MYQTTFKTIRSDIKSTFFPEKVKIVPPLPVWRRQPFATRVAIPHFFDMDSLHRLWNSNLRPVCQKARISYSYKISSNYSQSQTRRARELKFLENVYFTVCVMCHVSHVSCHVLRVTYHLSHVRCKKIPFSFTKKNQSFKKNWTKR